MRFRRLPAPLVLAALVPVATGLASSHPAAGEDAERPLLLRVADAADPGRDAAVAAWKALTEITKAGAFYGAEEYHQDYYRANRTAGYCRVVIAPKLEKLRLKK